MSFRARRWPGEATPFPEMHLCADGRALNVGAAGRSCTRNWIDVGASEARVYNLRTASRATSRAPLLSRQAWAVAAPAAPLAAPLDTALPAEHAVPVRAWAAVPQPVLSSPRKRHLSRLGQVEEDATTPEIQGVFKLGVDREARLEHRVTHQHARNFGRVACLNRPGQLEEYATTPEFQGVLRA